MFLRCLAFLVFITGPLAVGEEFQANGGATARGQRKLVTYNFAEGRSDVLTMWRDFSYDEKLWGCTCRLQMC